MKLRELITVTLLVFLVQGCWKRPPSYESHFHDEVTIDFPPGHLFDEIEPTRAKIDAMLRDREIGFWSGVMGAGEPSEVETVYLTMNFDLVDEVAFVQSLIDEGTLPQGVKLQFHEGALEPDDDMNESELL